MDYLNYENIADILVLLVELGLALFEEMCTGLFEMIVGVLTICHTQYT